MKHVIVWFTSCITESLQDAAVREVFNHLSIESRLLGRNRLRIAGGLRPAAHLAAHNKGRGRNRQ